jgi:hypothetical protein
VGRELREGWEKLNTAYHTIEQRLGAHHGNPAMVRLSGGRWLSWDGEFLWVISAKQKDKLLHCSKEVWLEVPGVLAELVEKTGVKLIRREPTG